MHSLNFPEQFIQWLMLCVSTAQYSIVLNGTSFGYFNGERGIRQGDPISPNIFVICMEVLSRLLNQARNVPEFRYHPGCKANKLNHLMFANDLMLISAADEFSPSWMKSQLDVLSSIYVRARGQQFKDSNVSFQCS